MTVKLIVDGKDIPINEFVEKILASTIAGAVTSLHGINDQWQRIKVEIERPPIR